MLAYQTEYKHARENNLRSSCEQAFELIKDIRSDYWKALVISLMIAGGVINLDEV